MSALKDEVASIVRSAPIPDTMRLHFLVDRLGGLCIYFENAAYAVMHNQSDYHGGYWEFYELSNGGWYMAPTGQEQYQFSCPNSFKGTLGSDAAGIAASLIGINHLLWVVHEHNPKLGRRLNDAFYALRDFALQHKEAAGILGVID